MKESLIESYFVKLCKEQGLLQYKFTSPARRSVPDRLLIHNGKAVFIEFKATGAKPTVKQQAEHKKLTDAGCEVFIIDSKEGVDNLLFFSLNIDKR